MNFRLVLPVAVCSLLAACASTPKPAAPVSTTAATPIPAPEKWVRTEIYFGLAPYEAEGLGLSAAEGSWRAFLDEEVTPRFPDGFTVLDGYGQWREGGELSRVRSRVLVIVHPDTPAKRAGIDALREAYRARTGTKIVLAVETAIAAPRF